MLPLWFCVLLVLCFAPADSLQTGCDDQDVPSFPLPASLQQSVEAVLALQASYVVEEGDGNRDGNCYDARGNTADLTTSCPIFGGFTVNLTKTAFWLPDSQCGEAIRRSCRIPINSYQTTFSSSQIPSSLWNYFGTPEGTLRYYPAALPVTSLDPRNAYWFVGAVSGPKTVVIIVDASGKGSSWGAIARTASQIVSSLSPFDFIKVMVIRGDRPTQLFDDQIASSDANCFAQPIGVRATVAARCWLSSWLEETLQPLDLRLEAHSLDAALDIAQQVFQDAETSLTIPTCRDRLVLMYVGEQIDAARYHRLRNVMRKLEKQVTPFYFASALFDESHAIRLACHTSGLYTRLSDESYGVSPLVRYFATGINGDTVWLPPSYDRVTSLAVESAAKPVRTSKHGLLGVVGIDIKINASYAAQAFSDPFASWSCEELAVLPANWANFSTYLQQACIASNYTVSCPSFSRPSRRTLDKERDWYCRCDVVATHRLSSFVVAMVGVGMVLVVGGILSATSAGYSLYLQFRNDTAAAAAFGTGASAGPHLQSDPATDYSGVAVQRAGLIVWRLWGLLLCLLLSGAPLPSFVASLMAWSRTPLETLPSPHIIPLAESLWISSGLYLLLSCRVTIAWLRLRWLPFELILGGYLQAARIVLLLETLLLALLHGVVLTYALQLEVAAPGRFWELSRGWNANYFSSGWAAFALLLACLLLLATMRWLHMWRSTLAWLGAPTVVRLSYWLNALFYGGASYHAPSYSLLAVGVAMLGELILRISGRTCVDSSQLALSNADLTLPGMRRRLIINFRSWKVGVFRRPSQHFLIASDYGDQASSLTRDLAASNFVCFLEPAVHQLGSPSVLVRWPWPWSGSQRLNPLLPKHFLWYCIETPSSALEAAIYSLQLLTSDTESPSRVRHDCLLAQGVRVNAALQSLSQCARNDFQAWPRSYATRCDVCPGRSSIEVNVLFQHGGRESRFPNE